MKDPARWRDPNGGADAETRALLLGSDAGAPTDTERERIWSGLAPQVQAPPTPPHVPPAAVSSGVVLGKVTLAVALVVATAVGWHAVRSREPSPRSIPEARVAHGPSKGPAAVTAPTVAPGVPAAPAPVVEKPTGRSPRPASPSLTKAITSGRFPPTVRTTGESGSVVRDTASPQSHGSAELARETAPTERTRSPEVGAPPQLVSNELLEEGRTLSRARAALRARDPVSALRLLQGTVRTAALAQEREALTIEALAARPRSRAEAAERARAFLAGYPDSPYRARIRAVALDER